MPGVGHSVLRTDFSGCAAPDVIAFLRAGRATCSATVPAHALQLPAAPYAPATVGALRPTRLAGTARPHAQRASRVTLTGIALRRRGARARDVPAARAARRATCRRRGSTLTLHGVEWVRGVRVSGRLDRAGRGTLTVSGPQAAAGTVTSSAAGASGTLGGRSFTL